MKRLYANHGSYSATCTHPEMGTSNTCPTHFGQCENCYWALSNTLAIEGDNLPSIIVIAGMEYEEVEKKMKITIKETGEEKKLVLCDENGQDILPDLLGSDFDRDDNGNDILTQEEYDFWEQYIADYKDDIVEALELAAALGVDATKLTGDIYSEVSDNDFAVHHEQVQRLINWYRTHADITEQ